MSGPSPSAQPFRFGLFEFDPQSGELRKQGIKIRLQGQPVEILALLLARPGEVVTREEFQKKLWPADTFVSFEQSLNAAMTRLRAGLGDPAETPRFVETLVGRGYRFIAPVDRAEPPAEPPKKGGGESSKARRWPWAAAAATLVFGVLIGWAFKPSRPVVPEQAHRFQLNAPEGSQFDPVRGLALSPDSRLLAFIASGHGKSGLWVRSLDAVTARLLPGTEGAFSPFWSPDSRMIAYWASGKIWRVGANGGASPIAICDEPFMIGGDWAPDGTIVFGSGMLGLRRVPASGGIPEMLTTPDASRGESSHLHPQLLPGGRILFTVVGKPEQAGIYATSLSNPRERIRLAATTGNGLYAADHLFWLRESTLVAQRLDLERLELSGERGAISNPMGADGYSRVLGTASASILVHGRTGGWQLTWLDRKGQADPERRSLGLPGGSSTFRISPDGRRIAVSRRSESGSDLWMVAADRDAWSRFTFLPRVGAPYWSPDGKQVMFFAGSPENLYRKETSGAGTEQRMNQSVNPQWPADWSPDGRLVLFTELTPDTQGDLWVLPVTPEGKPEAGVKPRPYLRSRFNEWGARFSPEPSPRWVAYASDESGKFEVYVQSFPEPRAKFQISAGGGTYPEWSPDGRELYFLASDRRLMVVGLHMRADSLAPSPPRELAVLHPGVGQIIQPYAVAPDGRGFLVQSPAGGSEPLEVVANWRALLNLKATR